MRRTALVCLLALPLSGCVTAAAPAPSAVATLAVLTAPAGSRIAADVHGDGLAQLDVTYPSFHVGPEWMYLWATHCDGEPGKTHSPLSFDFQGTPDSDLASTPVGIDTTHADDSGREYLHADAGTYRVHLSSSDCQWRVLVADCARSCGTEPSNAGVYTLSGHRSYDSALIDVTDNAEIAYTYDCTARASEHASPGLRFQLSPLPDPNQASLGSITDDRLAGSGVGHFYLDHAGPVSLSILVDDCQWSVRAGALDKVAVPAFPDGSPVPALPLKTGSHSHVVADASGSGTILSRPFKLAASWELAYALECNGDAAPDVTSSGGAQLPSISLIPGTSSQDLGDLPIPNRPDVDVVLPFSVAGTYGVEVSPPMISGCLWHYQLRD